MKKNYLLGILFFSALWGMSETILGGVLYRAHISYSSVPLTIIAFIILTIARVYLPNKGSSTLIASIAMLYKFLNTPFFACHLLGIFCLGLSYDMLFSFLKIKNKTLFALLTTYLGYMLFALTITYVFRYHYWIQEGFPRILRHVGIGGTMAAIGNAILVHAVLNRVQALKQKTAGFFELKPALATGSLSLITAGLWVIAAARCF